MLNLLTKALPPLAGPEAKDNEQQREGGNPYLAHLEDPTHGFSGIYWRNIGPREPVGFRIEVPSPQELLKASSMEKMNKFNESGNVQSFNLISLHEGSAQFPDNAKVSGADSYSYASHDIFRFSSDIMSKLVNLFCAGSNCVARRENQGSELERLQSPNAFVEIPRGFTRSREMNQSIKLEVQKASNLDPDKAIDPEVEIETREVVTHLGRGLYTPLEHRTDVFRPEVESKYQTNPTVSDNTPAEFFVRRKSGKDLPRIEKKGAVLISDLMIGDQMLMNNAASKRKINRLSGQANCLNMAGIENAIRRRVENKDAVVKDAIEVRLSPKELGSIFIRVSRGKRITLKIEAQRLETLKLLRKNVRVLLQNLLDTGVEGFDIEFGRNYSIHRPNSENGGLLESVNETTSDSKLLLAPKNFANGFEVRI
ncbi:flagellar hook-length control protein FliK [Pseudoponticoccus marisrubri]|uniref:flagellar hook-length control protein FliK n=1 Tax=Pseudoponticoccus marisrubri TaxID=1685382 RepID=UPI0012FD8F35|nr:flagellar hook-length control protein FliK [Pseudoponticoccus marisrubri]